MTGLLVFLGLWFCLACLFRWLADSGERWREKERWLERRLQQASESRPVAVRVMVAVGGVACAAGAVVLAYGPFAGLFSMFRVP
jgi:hypothetical protein